MCGIVAYTGFRDSKEVLLQGLRRLQYRGYDSAGVVVATKSGFQRVRTKGLLKNLEDKIAQGEYKGHWAMGHTRWATHGAPSENNAHPHKAGSIYIVHNGVIENAEELKAGLTEKNLSQFTSETDTEVVAFILADLYEKSGSLKTAVFETLALIKGEYAVVVMSEKAPGEFWAFKKGPSLLLGFGEAENKEVFIASDAQALLPYTRQVVFLQDGEVTHVHKSGDVDFYSKKDSAKSFTKIHKAIETLSMAAIRNDGKNKENKHNSYAFDMLKEIHEQPACVEHLLSQHLCKDELNLQWTGGDSKGFLDHLLKVRRLCIVACGSSYYAAVYGKYVIEKWARIPVEIDISSEFRYRDPVLVAEKTPVLLISQSGETADTLAVLKMTNIKTCPVLSLCNVDHSTLVRESDLGLQMFAGLEKGVASTKAFTCTLLVLYLLALVLAKKQNSLSTEAEEEQIKNLLGLSTQMRQVLQQESSIADLAELLNTFHGFIYLGRGVQYPLALEGALKMKELTYKLAEGYPAGEMKHGPLALIDDKMAVVGLLPSAVNNLLYKKTLTSLQEAKARKARLILIGSQANSTASALSEHFISLPSAEDDLLAILSAIPLQLMAYHTAVSLGHNVDQPRNLAKSVTVE